MVLNSQDSWQANLGNQIDQNGSNNKQPGNLIAVALYQDYFGQTSALVLSVLLDRQADGTSVYRFLHHWGNAADFAVHSLPKSLKFGCFFSIIHGWFGRTVFEAFFPVGLKESSAAKLSANCCLAKSHRFRDCMACRDPLVPSMTA